MDFQPLPMRQGHLPSIDLVLLGHAIQPICLLGHNQSTIKTVLFLCPRFTGSQIFWSQDPFTLFVMWILAIYIYCKLKQKVFKYLF